METVKENGLEWERPTQTKRRINRQKKMTKEEGNRQTGRYTHRNNADAQTGKH